MTIGDVMNIIDGKGWFKKTTVYSEQSKSEYYVHFDKKGYIIIQIFEDGDFVVHYC